MSLAREFRVGVAARPVAFNQDLRALVPSKDVDPYYVVHFLRSCEQRILDLVDRASHGTTRLTSDRIDAFDIPLPPLNEQRRIAEVLDRADALRAKRRAALALLDTLTQSIFLDMFGDPVRNSGGWPVTNLSTICKRITVGIVVRPASYYVPAGVPALRSLNIKPGRISLNDAVFVSERDNITRLAKTQLQAGDLVLVRTGQPGTAAVVPQELAGANAIDILIVTPHRSVVDATFLCHFFNSSAGRSLVLGNQRGQVQKHLNVGSLAEARIPLPPIGVQKELARRLAAVDKLRATHRASLAHLDALFASLQHRAFRGEL